MADVAIVIVNYGTAGLILDHLPAIRAEMASVGDARAYLVDNASPGDDADRLEAGTAGMDDVVLVRAPRNGGFAYGNNRGMDRAREDGAPSTYFFLNPDAYPRPGALARLLRTMADAPGAGIIGARLENEDGSPRSYAFRFPSALGELVTTSQLGMLHRLTRFDDRQRMAEDEPFACDWVTGAAFLVRAEAIEAAGPMDEGYFLYFEEVDWNLAITRAGWQVLCDPRARIVHYAGAATGLQGGVATAKPMPGYWYESWRRYFEKNHGRSYAALAAMGRTGGMAVAEGKARLLGRELSAGRARIGRFARLCLMGRPAGRA